MCGYITLMSLHGGLCFNVETISMEREEYCEVGDRKGSVWTMKRWGWDLGVGG